MRRNTIIGSTRNNLLIDLLYWWDLDTGGATVTDQHDGLVLTRETLGSGGTTAAGVAPDGGNCITFASAGGGDETRFINSSVAKPVSYDTAFTVNIWARDTGLSSTGNWRINHRSNPAGTGIQYWQVNRGATSGNNNHALWHDGGASANVNASFAAAATNTWMMYTLVRRGSTLEQWQNGVLVASTAIPAGTMDVGAAPYAIGGQGWAGAPNTVTSHRGQLWCAGQWGRALSATEIERLYNGGMGRKYAAL